MRHAAGMPAAFEGQAHDKKRKRAHGAERREKSKSSVLDSPASAQDIHSEVLLLENGILESRKNYNSIASLLVYMRPQDSLDGRDAVAAVALYRVFYRLMIVGSLLKNEDISTAENTIVQWLRERLQEYEEALLCLLQSADPTKQTMALALLMRLVKEKAAHLDSSEDVVWRRGIFPRIVQELVASTYGAPALDEFIEKYVTEYDDVRYYTFAFIA